MKWINTTGLTEEEIQEMVLQSMLEAGATPDEIAKVMVEQKLLRAIGSSPDDMSKSILKQLRYVQVINCTFITIYVQKEKPFF